MSNYPPGVPITMEQLEQVTGTDQNHDEDYVDARVEYVDNLLTAIRVFANEHAAGYVTPETKERAIQTIQQATLVSRQRAKRLMHKWFYPNR